MKIGKEFNDILYKNIMYLYVKDNMKTKNQLLKLKDKYEEQLEDMKNKENFLERVTTEKKQLNKRIDKIDKLFNNKELLTKQYAKRNKKFNENLEENIKNYYLQ